MSLFNIIIYLIVLTSIFGYINVRFLKMPSTIGMMVLSIIFSIIMLLVNYTNPELFHPIETVVQQINFTSVVLNVMLSFLLFAGALHTDTSLLRKESRTILLFAVIGVLISTFLIALMLYGVVQLINY